MQLNNGPEEKDRVPENTKNQYKKSKSCAKNIKQISSTHLGHFITMFNIHGSVHHSMTQ
jgi:hypothetical protein